jgi:hypothetical protein
MNKTANNYRPELFSGDIKEIIFGYTEGIDIH